jgi:hypothetical protein
MRLQTLFCAIDCILEKSCIFTKRNFKYFLKTFIFDLIDAYFGILFLGQPEDNFSSKAQFIIILRKRLH